MKKKVNAANIYYKYFNIGVDDPVYDEYEWVVNDRFVMAHNIHHIKHGANKEEHINNYMALSFNNHNKAHLEILKRDYLRDIHLQFMWMNPY